MAKALTLEVLLSSDETDGKLIERIKGLSFEDGIKLLEELVQKVESGSLPLDKAILCSERGNVIVLHLRELLGGAEEKLRLLPKSINSTTK